MKLVFDGRLSVLALVVVCLGLPLDQPWSAGMTALAVICLWTGRCHRSWRRWVGAGAVVCAVVLGRWFLPLPVIEEGHHVHLPAAADANLDGETVLPEAVRQALEAAWENLPPAHPWRPGSEAPFAFSPAGIWQTAGMTRVVHSIDFSGRVELKLGALNHDRFNFYMPEHGPPRQHIPYFVVYKIPSSLNGGRLCWQGKMFWVFLGPDEDQNQVKDVSSVQHTCQDIEFSRNENSLWIYGIETGPSSFSSGNPVIQSLEIVLEPPVGKAWLIGIDHAIRIVGAAIVLLLMVRIRQNWIFVPLASFFATVLHLATLDLNILSHGFILFESGHEGLFHASWGREILAALVEGEWERALRGGEDVFGFVPGYRYLMALNFLFFGDTIYGCLILVMLLPVPLFGILRLFLPRIWAWGVFLLFLVSPFLESFGFWHHYYVRLALRGLGEPVGAFLFLFALWSGLRAVQTGRLRHGFGLASALAGAVMICPHLLVGAGVLLVAVLTVLFRRREWGEMVRIVAGISLLVLIPLHDRFFGSPTALFPLSSFFFQNLHVTAGDYLAAGGHLLGIASDGEAFARVLSKLRGWIAPYEIWRQIGFVALGIALFWRQVPSSVRVLALVALVQQGMLLFYQSSGRYGHLTWALTLLVLLALIWHGIGRGTTRGYSGEAKLTGRGGA
jgi:hypothetical protein